MSFLSWLFSSEKYEYGTCDGRKARRHKRTGDVQFILWKAGEQGHKKDFWISFGYGWAERFTLDNEK